VERGDAVVGEPLDGRIEVLSDDGGAPRPQEAHDLAPDPAGGPGDDRHRAVQSIITATHSAGDTIE
jgi:hypothetical protein